MTSGVDVFMLQFKIQSTKVLLHTDQSNERLSIDSLHMTAHVQKAPFKESKKAFLH